MPADEVVDTSMKKLGIVVSSTRPARIGPKVAAWVESVVPAGEWEVELLDLSQIALPFLDEVDMPANGNYALPHTKAWAEQVCGVGALVVVTPQYNKSFPASIKNAIDFLYSEWHAKPIALVGYGWSGAAQATQALAEVLTHVKADVVDQINLVFDADLTPEGELTVGEDNADRLRLALAAMAQKQSQQQPAA